jgi:opacity protein-like surface antigen
VELKAWIVEPAIAYTVLENQRGRLDLLGGARYLWLKSELEFDISGPLRNEKRKASDSDGVWDGIVGLRGQLNLSPNWYVPYYADIGAGGTDLTWQLFGGIGYRFSKVDVVLAYRYLDWDFDDDSAFDDMNIHGPFAGVKFRF